MFKDVCYVIVLMLAVICLAPRPLPPRIDITEGVNFTHVELPAPTPNNPQ